MPGLEELKVPLTKNGYFRVADMIEKHPRHEVLANIRGTYLGINLDRAQIANMLSADPITGELPEEWDELRNYSKPAINALVFIAILFSHHTKEEYRNKWPGPSVGAFPFCPSNNANQDAQRARLETHLSRLILAIEESASYIEEAGFTSSLNGLAGSRSE
jgi:hypothetical protein